MHWGKGFYQPKWTSTNYTLLDLRNLSLPQNCQPVRETIAKLLKEEKGRDGGLNPSGTINNSDVCINGMALNYMSWFKAPEEDLKSIVDFLIGQQMPDGGFNCRSNRSGAHHSSLHSTLSVLEGIETYRRQGYQYQLPKLISIATEAQEFILLHRLYKSDHTGKVIDPKFLRLTYPGRWRYDILRALDYFQYAERTSDTCMRDALEVLLSKRNKDGTWNVQAKHPGAVHFEMEKAGKPSRWNTLRALRVLKYYQNLTQQFH